MRSQQQGDECLRANSKIVQRSEAQEDARNISLGSCVRVRVLATMGSVSGDDGGSFAVDSFRGRSWRVPRCGVRVVHTHNHTAPTTAPKRICIARCTRSVRGRRELTKLVFFSCLTSAGESKTLRERPTRSTRRRCAIPSYLALGLLISKWLVPRASARSLVNLASPPFLTPLAQMPFSIVLSRHKSRARLTVLLTILACQPVHSEDTLQRACSQVALTIATSAQRHTELGRIQWATIRCASSKPSARFSCLAAGRAWEGGTSAPASGCLAPPRAPRAATFAAACSAVRGSAAACSPTAVPYPREQSRLTSESILWALAARPRDSC